MNWNWREILGVEDAADQEKPEIGIQKLQKPPDHPPSVASVSLNADSYEPGGRSDRASGKRPEGACFTCSGTRWWVSVHDKIACAVCHPPAAPELVAEWIEVEPLGRSDHHGSPR